MKATELMIGDWICYKDKLIKITKGIYDEKVYTNGSVILDFKLNPILLTVKILEKNEFTGEGYLILELDEFSYLEYYPFEGRLRKYWHGIDEWNNHSVTNDIIFQCHYKYIHELQHALRLCGLTLIRANSFLALFLSFSCPFLAPSSRFLAPLPIH